MQAPEKTKTQPRVTSLSIAAPAYNEGASIGEIVRTWSEYLSRVEQLSDFEIVVCNDGSKDNTIAILNELSSSDPHIKPVSFAVNQGAAAALSHAIGNTHHPWVLLLDSDGQYGIDNVMKLIAEVETHPETKAVIGVRVHKHDSAFTRFGSAVSGWLCNLFHETNYRDFNCALKLVDGETLRSLTLEAKGLNYSGEMSSKLIERGVVFREVEVEHKKRVAGRSSSQNMRAAWHRLLFVMYLGFRQFLIRQKVLQVKKPCQ
jgi:dolichol-phosphate mannosyltransferase